MQVKNEGRLPVRVYLDPIPGARVLDDPDGSMSRAATQRVDEVLGSGEVSRHYAEQHREMLLATPGLVEYVEEEELVAIQEAEPLEEEVPGVDQPPELTPTKPKRVRKQPERNKGARGRRKR